MFGRPQWFSIGTGRRDLRPRMWQGWLYLLAWLVILMAPSVTLLARHLVPEAAIWTLATFAALRWDIRRIRAVAAEPLDVSDILVIDERGSRMQRTPI